MADGVQITVVKNDFEALAVKLANEAEQLVAKTANGIEDVMKSTTSARIASTIKTQVTNSGRTATVYAGDRKRAIHAGFEEFGTVYEPARAFATPAAEDHRSEFLDAMQRLLDRGL